MSPVPRISRDDDEETNLYRSDDVELCPVCRQEYADRICPIKSADCPYAEDEDDDDDFGDPRMRNDLVEDDEGDEE